MSKKMTVVEKFQAIGEMLNGTYDGDFTVEQAVEFLDERIVLTKKKNASGKSGELAPKQKEKMEQTEGYKSAIVNSMSDGVQYTPTDLLKVVEGLPAECNTQKLTPMLTALVKENRLTKATVKGRSVYSLPSVAEVAED